MGAMVREELSRHLPKVTNNRCNYSSLVIPKNENKTKRYPGSTMTKSDLRPRANEIAHPFYRPSTIEGFTLCYRHGKPSLLDGRPCFPVMNDGERLIVHMRALKFDRVQGLSKWISAYWRSLDKSTAVGSADTLKVIGEEDIVEFNRPSYLDTTVLPQLEEPVELLRNEELRQKSLQEAQLALNSLLDYIVLNAKSGIYTEDIYGYLLQNCCDSAFKLKVLIGSIVLHIEALKIDQFSVVEKLLSQTLYIVEQELTVVDAMELHDSIMHLLQIIHHRFPRDHFRPLVQCQLFRYHVKCQDIENSFHTLNDLVKHEGAVPNNKLLESYLLLLQSKFPAENIDLTSIDSKNEPLKSKLLLNKFMRYSTLRLGYLSALTPLIHHKPTEELLQFLIPLCTHFNELLCLVRLAMEGQLCLSGKPFELILNRCLSFDYMGSKEKAVSIMKLYNIIFSKTNGEQQQQLQLQVLVESLARLGAYPMLAKLIEEKTIDLGKNVALTRSIVEKFSEAANWNDSDTLGPETPLNINMRRQFFRRYILPVQEKLELTDRYEKFVGAVMNASV